MVINEQKITIIRIRKGGGKNINEEIKWLGHSLGLFGIRDKDSSCYRLFVELLKSSKTGEPLSSDELAYRLRLTRATVIHHMNKLLESGIVVQDKNRYALRVNNMELLIDELKQDLFRTMKDLKSLAKEIDKALGL